MITGKRLSLLWHLGWGIISVLFWAWFVVTSPNLHLGSPQIEQYIGLGARLLWAWWFVSAMKSVKKWYDLLLQDWKMGKYIKQAFPDVRTTA